MALKFGGGGGGLYVYIQSVAYLSTVVLDVRNRVLEIDHTQFKAYVAVEYDGEWWVAYFTKCS